MKIDFFFFLLLHQKIAVAGEAHHRTARVDDGRAHAGGHAVAHGPAGRGELGAKAAVAVKAVHP